MKLFRTIKNVFDPMTGQTVIHFRTSGCMGQIHRFVYIGKIISSIMKDKLKYYTVEIQKDESGEKRDGNLLQEHRDVPSWYLQKMGDFFITYD